MKLLSLVFSLVCLSGSAMAATPGETFQFSVDANGVFSLEMDAVLSAGVTLDQAHQVLSDSNNLSAVSDIVSKASITSTGASTYTLSTTWERYHVSRQVLSDCVETKSSAGFEQSCKLRVVQNHSDSNDKGQTGGLFTSGGTDTKCEQASSGVSCQVKVFGQAKPINLIVIRKSAADLALNGAGFNLQDTSLILTMLSDGESAEQAKAALPGSHLADLVSALYNQLDGSVNSIPAGKTLHASGDLDQGLSSFQMGIR